MPYDIILLHAPSVYDFRDRDDVLFAYLSNSDGAHVSQIYEMPPVGLLAILQHLRRSGFQAEFFNVASQMLRDPDLDVEAFFKRTPAAFVGIDLHWVVHAQGALELAALYKRFHPEAKVVLGGISSTYFHEELVTYPQIDYVLRGYDTLQPIEQLLRSGNDPDQLRGVPNLTWTQAGAVVANPLSHTPEAYSAEVNWGEIFQADGGNMTPYNIVIPQAGCEYGCRFCGGSSYFYGQHMGGSRVMHKTPEVLRRELESITAAHTKAHTVTMIDFWHEYPELFEVGASVFTDERIGAVHFSLNRLPSVDKGRRMSLPAKAVIELSPDSHDLKVAKASGRGKFTMEEMEAWIDALIDEVYSFEIYFMIGMPYQDAHSVWDTVDYCGHLLKKYRGRRVAPYLCPMMPFLDPGSEFFDHADQWGYRLFHRTLGEHAGAMTSLSLRERLNYETEWLDRDALIDISYQAVRALTLLKKEHAFLPGGIAEGIVARIDETHELLREIDTFQAIPETERDAALERTLKQKVLAYNRDQLAKVRSQQRPVDYGFAKRQWFDTEAAFSGVQR